MLGPPSRNTALNSAAAPAAIASAWMTSAAASSRRPAPIARAIEAAIAPPIAMLAICCISIISGNTSARPASASRPKRPTKCASTLVVTAISKTLTTRLGTASRSRVGTIGPSSIRRVRAAAGDTGFTAVSVIVQSFQLEAERRQVGRLAVKIGRILIGLAQAQNGAFGIGLAHELHPDRQAGGEADWYRQAAQAEIVGRAREVVGNR